METPVNKQHYNDKQSTGMKKKNLNKPKLDVPLSKEGARANYENLADENQKESKETFEDLVERKIQKAMAEGGFDNLPGKGKPIDLKHYYDVPEHLRIAYHMMKDSGYIPEEVRLKKEMEILKEKIKNCRSNEDKQKLMQELNELSQQFHFHMEYNKRFKNS